MLLEMEDDLCPVAWNKEQGRYSFHCDKFSHTNPFWSHRMREKGIFDDR